ncbi:hypothetical protein DSO57_1006125 [Entomophthora muscae]|uniref:Uncharacterized protein n=1 Tax=Entomophthora muscae TaxID=34485 RepID=A0ACC2UHM1_9FUNG|nr:hypothetical protein DSO57_1006125 [Entomophthora muscae]
MPNLDTPAGLKSSSEQSSSGPPAMRNVVPGRNRLAEVEHCSNTVNHDIPALLPPPLEASHFECRTLQLSFALQNGHQTKRRGCPHLLSIRCFN